jgi:hypothetical protein
MMPSTASLRTFPLEALEGDFLVLIQEGKRKRALSAGTVNHAFRNVDPEDITIERPGATTRGGFTHLAEKVSVTKAGAGLDPKEAVQKLVEQLYAWGKSGAIDLGPPDQ